MTYAVFLYEDNCTQSPNYDTAKHEALFLGLKTGEKVMIYKAVELVEVTTKSTVFADSLIATTAPAQEEKKSEGKKKTLIEKSQLIEDNEILKEVIENAGQKEVVEDPEINKEVEPVFSKEAVVKDSLLESVLKDIAAAQNQDQLKKISEMYFAIYSGDDTYNQAYNNKAHEFQEYLYYAFLDERKPLNRKDSIALAESPKYKVLEMSDFAENFKTVKEEDIRNLNIINLVKELKESVKTTKDLNTTMAKYPEDIKKDLRVINAVTNFLKTLGLSTATASEEKETEKDPINDTIDSDPKLDNWFKVKADCLDLMEKSGNLTTLDAVRDKHLSKYPELTDNKEFRKAYWDNAAKFPPAKATKKASSDPDN